MEEFRGQKDALEENHAEGEQPLWKLLECTTGTLMQMFGDPDAEAAAAEQQELQEAAQQAAVQAAQHQQNLTQTANAAHAATTALTQQTAAKNETKVSTKILENPPKSKDYKDKKQYKDAVAEWIELLKTSAKEEEMQYFLKTKGLEEKERESTKGAKDLKEFIEKLCTYLLPTQIQQVLNAFGDLVDIEPIENDEPKDWIVKIENMRRELATHGIDFTDKAFGIVMLYFAKLGDDQATAVKAQLVDDFTAPRVRAVLQATVTQNSTNKGGKAMITKFKGNCDYCGKQIV